MCLGRAISNKLIRGRGRGEALKFYLEFFIARSRNASDIFGLSKISTPRSVNLVNLVGSCLVKICTFDSDLKNKNLFDDTSCGVPNLLLFNLLYLNRSLRYFCRRESKDKNRVHATSHRCDVFPKLRDFLFNGVTIQH